MSKKLFIEKAYNVGILESYKKVDKAHGADYPILGSFETKGMAAENTVSQNRTLYSEKVWNSPYAFGAGGRYFTENGELKKAQLFGSLDHPSDGHVDLRLEEAAIAWYDIKRNPDGTWDGKADILNNEKGRVLNTILEYAKLRGGGELLGVSSRAFGESELTEANGEQVEAIVPETFELKSFDFVYDPSFVNRANSISESKKTKKQLKPLYESIRSLSKDDKEHKEYYESIAEQLKEASEENQYEADKYKGKEWGVFAKRSKSWVAFGTEKEMKEKAKALNKIASEETHKEEGKKMERAVISQDKHTILEDASESQEVIDQIIKDRADELDFYVLHFDVSDTSYLNDIEFKTYADAKAEWDAAEQINENDRIELIFSPDLDKDDKYEDNVMMMSKGATYESTTEDNEELEPITEADESNERESYIKDIIFKLGLFGNSHLKNVDYGTVVDYITMMCNDMEDEEAAAYHEKLMSDEAALEELAKEIGESDEFRVDNVEDEENLELTIDENNQSEDDNKEPITEAEDGEDSDGMIVDEDDEEDNDEEDNDEEDNDEEVETEDHMEAEMAQLDRIEDLLNRVLLLIEPVEDFEGEEDFDDFEDEEEFDFTDEELEELSDEELDYLEKVAKEKK